MFIDHLAATMTPAEFAFWLLLIFVVVPALLTYLLNPRQSTCKHDWEHVDDTPTTRRFTCRLCRKERHPGLKKDHEGNWVVIEEGETAH